jgi:cobalt-zinc-cadmium efflux system protein
VASAHLGITPGAELATVLADARTALHDEFGIDHATLQVEPVGATGDCQTASW